MSVVYGKDTPKLGFGLMRLPKRGVVINVEQVKTMVDLFLEAGFTYFDTAFVYPGSEPAIRKALVERYPRDLFTLATKLNVMVAPTEKSARKQFAASMERTGAGYFDYYLLHALMENNYKKYEKLHLWEFVNEQKEKGVAVLNVGEDLDVLLGLCDRIMVLCHGAVTGIVDAKTTTKEQLGLLMTGAMRADDPKDPAATEEKEVGAHV